MERMLIVVLFLTLLQYETDAYPGRWYTDTTPGGLLESQSKKISNNRAERTILSSDRYSVNEEEDMASRTDGKIIFPSDDDENPTPHFSARPRPSCANSTYCESTHNYPNEYVQAALRMNKDLKLFSNVVDLVPDVVHRVNAQPEDSPLCESYEKVVYPKVAQSKDKEWLFVVNQEGFTQGVRVETCGNENTACNLIEGFAEGYKTTCKQKFIYRQLVALTSVGQLRPEKFRFPASCCCHIKFTGDALAQRMGVSLGKKAELPMSKATEKK